MAVRVPDGVSKDAMPMNRLLSHDEIDSYAGGGISYSEVRRRNLPLRDAFVTRERHNKPPRA